MKRRRFILCASATVLSLSAGGLFHSLSRLSAPDAMRKQYMSQPIEGLTQEEAMILYLASLAPSGHNAQPWTVEIKAPQRWIIASVPSRQLPAVDPRNREMLLSVGAFLEILSLAAQSCGYEADIRIFTEDPFHRKIAAVHLTKSDSTNAVENAIVTRRTLRKNLQKNALRAADLSTLIGNYADSVAFYPRESIGGAYLGQATLAANQTQMNRADAQRELAEWIRWTDHEAAARGNGLTPESMEMNRLLRWYVKRFFHKSDVQSAQFKDSGLQAVKEQTENCAGWLVVQSAGTSATDVIHAGRVLAAVWLGAREKSIAFHPMTQILEKRHGATPSARNSG